ncbi:hypothetical protein OsI_11885 [Oryza sativa Indica Group]|uniref:Uncharacterized protein n=1 Tax=Oryza sativa subsp. indica TaxID=39946 RepID=B8AQM9_ORYSI|nr:hypothetical protein OsI_11885 [Oryza sativa Indica Group]
MGFLCRRRSSAAPAESFSLLCEEDSESVFGSDDDGVEETATMAPELGKMMSLGFSASHHLGDGGGGGEELVGSFMEKEVEQMVETARGEYLTKLSNGGIELSCRIAAIDWICKVQAYYSFGPLCAYLAVNYLDRFLSSVEFSVTNDMPWMQQLLIVACLSLAAKMEETAAPGTLDLQVCNPEYVFDKETIHRMEIIVLTTLKWRMQAVTPFTYIGHFLDKINEGNRITSELISRCTEIILSTMKATVFLRFRPSEIATAVALSVVADGGRVLDFGGVLESSKLPVDKDNVGRCHQAMQEMALVMQNSTASPSGQSLGRPSTFNQPIRGSYSESAKNQSLIPPQICSPRVHLPSDSQDLNRAVVAAMEWQRSGDRQQQPERRSEGVGPERRWSAVARDGGGGGTPATAVVEPPRSLSPRPPQSPSRVPAAAVVVAVAEPAAAAIIEPAAVAVDVAELAAATVAVVEPAGVYRCS